MGERVIDHDGFSTAKRHHVAFGALYQTPPTRGQVKSHLRAPQTKALEVDQVDVSAISRRDNASVGESNCARRGLSLAVNDLLEWDGRLPVSYPVGQHEGGHTAVANGATMRTGIGQAHQGVGRGM